MAEFMSHQGSKEFIKPTTFNLSEKDLLTETEQTIKENSSNAYLRNKERDSKSVDDGAGDRKVWKNIAKFNKRKVICSSMSSRLSISRSYKLNVKDVTQV